MKWRFIRSGIIYVLFSSAIVSAQDHSDLIKIDLKGKSLLDLQNTGLAFDHGHYSKGEYFIGDFSPAEKLKLRSFGFQFEKAEPESIHSLRNSIIDCYPDTLVPPYYNPPINYEYGSMGGFLTLDELYENLELMHDLYPNLITQKSKIANITTEEGRPIYYFKISDNPNQDEDEPEALYTALHHAREPASMSQMIFFMWYLLENYGNDVEVKRLVDSRELYFVPCVNPDGYRYNQTTNPSGMGYWRKNRTFSLNGTVGVDLNRNYGYEWAFNNIGSSPNGDEETYRGESAFSESETQAIRELCRQRKFKIAINYHTFGNIMIIPWGFSNVQTSENEQFYTLAKEFTKYNKYTIGTATTTLNYQVNGVSDDWMYGDTTSKEKIYAFTPEIGESFWPSRQDIGRINQDAQYINFSSAWNAGSVARMSEISSGNLEPEEAPLKLLVHRTGLVSNNIKISCESNYPNAIKIYNPEVFDLEPVGQKIVEVKYEYLQGLPKGTVVNFKITLETGEYIETIDVPKIYLGTPYWRDDANNLDYWHSSNADELELTDEDFNSAPSCFTDSPHKNRESNKNFVVVSNEEIDLSNAHYAYLSYKIKYDLNPEEDYAQFLVSVDGNKYHPICGRYSIAGNLLQGIDQPVYTGKSSTWLSEWIDLKDFLGSSINLQIKVGTGLVGNYDGFYIDDIRIYTDLISSNTGTQRKDNMNLFPQPAKDELWIDSKEAYFDKIMIFNVLGQNQPVEFNNEGSLWKCNIKNLAGGLYNLVLLNGQTMVKQSKIIIE